MDLVVSEIFRACGYLFISGIVVAAWKFAHDAVLVGNLYKTLGKGLLWCVGIAVSGAIMMGSPTCEIGGDALYGGCEQYADNGFEPTSTDKAARFAYLFTLLYVPVVIGSLNGRKKAVTTPDTPAH